jgi:hypothetical protein
MMGFPPDPPRWKDEQGQANLAERAAGETIRALPRPEPLAATQLARIAARIRAKPPRRLHRWVPLTVALLLGIATAASAARLNILPGWLTGAKPKTLATATHDSPTVRTARKMRTAAAGPVPGSERAWPTIGLPPTSAEPPAAQPSPGVETPGAGLPGPPLPNTTRRPGHRSVEPMPAAHPASPQPSSPFSAPGPAAFEPRPAEWPGLTPVARTTAVAEPAARVVSAESPAAAEPKPGPTVSPPGSRNSEIAAKYLSEALRKLRVEHDAKATLSLLDRHGSALATNALGHEALILRVEALLALGRQGEVLRLLDGAALSDVAASHSLLVTRGELRAAAHRCADGVGDFGLVLAESGQPERQALFGRALCRKQLGDTAGAQTDLERFRREFPTDPRLGELERRLGTLP